MRKYTLEEMEERFWGNVEMDDSGCWVWCGQKNQKGYGMFYGKRNPIRSVAHRVSWMLLVGEIPDDLVSDHLCRNRACVNPGHLEMVTNRENVLRGEAPAAKHARKTHCKHGHPFNKENTYIRKTYFERMCRTCKRNGVAKIRARRKEAQL